MKTNIFILRAWAQHTEIVDKMKDICKTSEAFFFSPPLIYCFNADPQRITHISLKSISEGVSEMVLIGKPLSESLTLKKILIRYRILRNLGSHYVLPLIISWKKCLGGNFPLTYSSILLLNCRLQHTGQKCLTKLVSQKLDKGVNATRACTARGEQPKLHLLLLTCRRAAQLP